MSYRFIWKKIASKAIGSAIAKGLMAINKEEIWDQIARTESLSTEHVVQLKQDIDARLNEVEAAGRKERELVKQVVAELVGQVLKGGKGS